MSIEHTINILTQLYDQIFNETPLSVQKLPQSGSDRIYYRLSGSKQNVVGAFNADIRENEAFFSFTQTFRSRGIHVPELLLVAPDRQHYILTDLGNKTLFDFLNNPSPDPTDKSTLCELKLSLIELIKIQIEGGEYIDFSKCYPRSAFDRQSILWDLNYFKYEFLKLAGIPFNEQALEDDFNTLASFLLEAQADYFMYRDFQSRNIMIVRDVPWFIDYQGGRKGPLQYDLASILYSPKTRLNETQRDVLLQFYLAKANERISIDKAEFAKYYYGFVLIRILQALGAYGFRGLYEKKANFKNSIPSAILNLTQLFDTHLSNIQLPQLKNITAYLAKSKWAEIYSPSTDKLTIRVSSFSYKKSIPDDPSENGGGFVFDCRGLPNPGRFSEYKKFSGRDQNVIAYLEEYATVKTFQQQARGIVEISIQEYLKRDFKHLCVNFGCTGGQHRSVYHAEKFSTWVQNNYPVEVVLVHTEINNWINNE